MKDIYELLNDVDIDTDYYEDMDVNMDNITKKRVKKTFKRNINTKKRFNKKAAAAAVICVICIGGLLIPKEYAEAFVKRIPVINTVFEKFRGAGYIGDYKSYTNIISQEVSDKGFTVRIDEVVLDQNELDLVYTIKTNKDINKLIKDGPFPFSPGKVIKINGKSLNTGGGGTLRRIDKNTVQCINSRDIIGKEIPNRFTMSVDFKQIANSIGNWKFTFNVEKSEIEKKIKEFDINKSIVIKNKEGEDTRIDFKKFNISPISSALTFKSNKPVDLGTWDFIVKDEDNNQLQMKGASCSSSILGAKGYIQYSAYYKIPKKIQIIPYKWSKPTKEVKYSVRSKKSIDQFPIELKQGKIGKLIIKSVEYKSDKTVIKYTTEGLAPLMQAEDIVLYDEKGNKIMDNDNEYSNLRKDFKKPNEYTKEYPKLDKNKKYYAATRDFLDVYFDTANKIEVELK